jgi:predicted phosphohydrolase
VTYLHAGHNINPLTLSEPKPAAFKANSGKNPGFPMVKMATPNGTINLPRERIKTNQESWDGRIPGRQDEMRSYVKVKGNKSPYDGDLLYWSQRNSKLYSGSTSKALQKQNHSCGHCGLRFIGDELVHLHHIDGNHDNWKPKNLQAVHESCHDYLHMGKSAS